MIYQKLSTLLLAVPFLMVGTRPLEAATIVNTQSFNNNTYHLVSGDD